MQQAVAQLALTPISAWRSSFQDSRDIARNSRLKFLCCCVEGFELRISTKLIRRIPQPFFEQAICGIFFGRGNARHTANLAETFPMRSGNREVDG